MSQKHILMVDDVTTNLKCAAEVLKDNYKLSMAKSGRQALDFLSRTCPDLILLDINMPDMDGYDTLRTIQSNPAYADIPVIFLTGDSETESEIKGLELGAMDYIRKPFEPEILVGRIERILQITDAKRSLEQNACKDGLTGVWNRRYLESRVEKLCQEGNPGVFFLFDMDNFKIINDHFGHIMGDHVLIKFGEVLNNCAGHTGFAGRLGGDEFVLFLQGEFSERDITATAENLLKEVEREVNIVKTEGEHISVSVGIACAPEDGTDFLTLYNKADKALYHVKQNGKSGYHIYREKEQYTFQNGQEGRVSLIQLCEMFEEHSTQAGAFDVEYEGFRRIYQFVERCVERSDREVQILLFSLKNEDKADNEICKHRMDVLNDVIVNSLRKGDVATRYNASQYVVILMDTNRDNGIHVAERIVGKALAGEEIPYSIDFDIQTIKKESAR